LEYFLIYWQALTQFSNEIAPYILFGLLFAGILHELIPDSMVTKHLGNDNFISVIKATLFGMPLPLCSCGVIPLATSIKKSGASNGATLSFIISTPITGIDSILVTYGILGWVFTVYRIITSMIMATVAGILTNLSITPETSNGTSSTAGQAGPESCNSGCCTCKGKKDRATDAGDAKPWGFSLSSALHYAFAKLLRDITKPLFWGLVIGALITVATPGHLSETLIKYNWFSYAIAVGIAIPMYVCATASLPIAAGLMLAGVSPGAAFVFLSAGPATNTVTIGIVKKILGSKALGIYLGCITAGSLLFGLGLDWLFGVQGISVQELVHLPARAGWLAVASALLLWAMLLYFLAEPWIARTKPGSCCTKGEK